MNLLTIVRRAVDVALVGLVALGLATLAGSSMEPTIPLGAAVVTADVGPADLRVGDVVSLTTGSESQTVFTHRIARLITRPDGLWIETKGDANVTADPVLTPASSVLGRVLVGIPGAGYLLRFLTLPSGFAAVISLVTLLVVLSWLLDSFAGDRRAPRPTTSAGARAAGEAVSAAAVTAAAAVAGPAAAPRPPMPARPAATERPGATLIPRARPRGGSTERIRHAIAPRSAAAVRLPAQ